MITVVYPLASQSDYTEFKYSLRSLDTYLPKPFEIVIIGEKIPDWINNITWIELPDIPGRKLPSVRKKVLAGLHYAGSDILFMNDDFFLLSESDFPYYESGHLKTCANSGSKQLQNRLKELQKPQRNFELHYPTIFKQDLRSIIENFPSDCLLRSAYCNWLGVQGPTSQNFKFVKMTKPEVIQQAIKERPFISTGEYSLNSVLPYLFELFPNKSTFEL